MSTRTTLAKYRETLCVSGVYPCRQNRKPYDEETCRNALERLGSPLRGPTVVVGLP